MFVSPFTPWKWENPISKASSDVDLHKSTRNGEVTKELV